MTKYVPLRREPLYHLTPRINQPLITMQGLLTSKDRRGAGRIWLCAPFVVEKIASHLAELRNAGYIEYAVFGVDWWNVVEGVKRTKVEGAYWIDMDVPPSCVRYCTALAYSALDKRTWQVR